MAENETNPVAESEQGTPEREGVIGTFIPNMQETDVTGDKRLSESTGGSNHIGPEHNTTFIENLETGEMEEWVMHGGSPAHPKWGPGGPGTSAFLP